MAHDKSPPQNRLIILFAVLSVATLAALSPMFQSYFNSVIEGQTSLNRAPRPCSASAPCPRGRPCENGFCLSELEVHQRDQALSVTQAMKKVAREGRAAAAIAPHDSEDLGALEGWQLTKNERAVARARRAMQAMAELDAGVDGAAASLPAESLPSESQPAATVAPARPRPAARPTPTRAQPVSPATPSPAAQPPTKAPSAPADDTAPGRTAPGRGTPDPGSATE